MRSSACHRDFCASCTICQKSITKGNLNLPRFSKALICDRNVAHRVNVHVAQFVNGIFCESVHTKFFLGKPEKFAKIRCFGAIIYIICHCLHYCLFLDFREQRECRYFRLDRGVGVVYNALIGSRERTNLSERG